MSKELFVSTTPHETKVAIVEDDQLVEVYYERENEYTLAGSVYKGRVNRVLPGMQSAFVEIGLERDAFLYVTDFFETPEDGEDTEFEPLPGSGDEHTPRAQIMRDRAPVELHMQGVETADAHAAGSQELYAVLPETPELEADPGSADTDEAIDEQTAEAPLEAAAGVVAPAPETAQSDRGRRFNRRRRGHRGRGFPESKFDARDSARQSAQEPPRTARSEREPAGEMRHTAPPTYQPIILPGESISKYRNRAPVQGAPMAPSTSSTPPAQADAIAVPAQQYEERSYPDGSQAHAATAAHEAVRPQEVVPLHEPVTPPRRPTEEIDVHAILQKQHDTAQSRRDESEHATGHPAAAATFTPAFTKQDAKFGQGSGVIEEEEIEEEESEHPLLMGGLDEEEYEDFEEELLDRVDELGQATTDASNRAPLNEESKSELHGPDHDTTPAQQVEFDVQDVQEDENDDLEVLSADGHVLDAEGLEIVHSTDDGEASGESAARAEVRGPSGTQPKVGFDRNRSNRDRGRRGRRPPRSNAPRGRRFQRGPQPQISDLLKEGQEILVQIAKEPIGKKGARITSHIALPGRFLVYMPTVNHNGVSRKIASQEERVRLKRIILSERQSAGNGSQQGGFIVRTAAGTASEEDLRADIRFLLNLWHEIKNRAESSNSPALIYHDLNLVERILRDQISEGFSHIWVDGEQEYERVLRFMNRFQPNLVKRVKLYTKEQPLFEQFNLHEEINKALKSKVWLKSGGYIVINQTEALVAIDVNTGKYVGKTQRLEDTIVKTNVDAIKEIVRQIRLRDLGGIIVIDFIDMDERKNRQKVMQALEEALENDRAPSKVLQFNDFGLVAITRKRVKQSLERTLGSPCTYCTGTGLIKSVATICNEIYVEMRKMAKHLDRGDVIVRVNPEVGKSLKANNARWLQDMEDLTGKTVIVKPDATLHQEQFDIH